MTQRQLLPSARRPACSFVTRPFKTSKRPNQRAWHKSRAIAHAVHTLQKTRHLFGPGHMAVYQRFEYSTTSKPKSAIQQNLSEETPGTLWADRISSRNKYAHEGLSRNVQPTEPSSLPTSDKHSLGLFCILGYCALATKHYYCCVALRRGKKCEMNYTAGR